MFLLRYLNPAFNLRFFLLFATVFLTLPVIAQVQTGAAQLVVKLTTQTATVEEILKEIQEKAGVKFSYSNEALPLQKKVRLKNPEATIEEILQTVFAGTNVTWLFRPDQILLFQKSESKATGNSSQKGGKHTISGYIREAGSREAIIGATVYAPQYKAGLSTNNYGFYSLTLPADSVELVFSFVGYKQQTLKTDLRKDLNLDIELQSDAYLNEVVITAEAQQKASRVAQMSQVDVPVHYVKEMPALLGEKDVLRTIQMMPGVQKGDGASVGMYVRGGGPDQNLIILDDATVYNATHSLGFCSLFNGDALKNISLTKGGFPARYGGRLSSVIEMNMKEGNKEKFHGEAGIGLLTSRVMIEGPIKKNKASFLISGRRLYIFDLLLTPLMPEEMKFGYNFYDGTLKFNYDFSRKDKLYVSSYLGRDKFFFESRNGLLKQDLSMHWGNFTGTARWNHLFNDQLFSNTSFIFSQYRFVVNQENRSKDKTTSIRYFSGIQDFTLKTDFDFYISPTHTLKLGGATTFHHFTPNALQAFDSSIDYNRNARQDMNSQESAVYAESNLELNQKLLLNAGMRFSYFYAGKQHFLNPEPRVSAAYRLQPNLAVKVSFATMNQFVHLLSNTGVGMPIDLWVPATDKVMPQQSHQVAMGFARDFEKPEVMLEIEGYYKKSNRIITYRDNANFLSISSPDTEDSDLDWEENVTSGQGWSYGAEFLLQKKTGRFTGWVGYTLSWAQHQFDSLNEGRKFYARYDRRHDVSVTGTFDLNEKVKFSANWVYGTGNAITLPVAEYEAPEHVPTPEGSGSFDYITPFGAYEYGERNGFRMPAYHRFDVGVQFRKKLKWGERTWDLSIYNIYNRKNPFSISVVQVKNRYRLRQFSLFTLIPSVSYNFKF